MPYIFFIVEAIKMSKIKCRGNAICCAVLDILTRASYIVKQVKSQEFLYAWYQKSMRFSQLSSLVMLRQLQAYHVLQATAALHYKL